MRMAGGESEYVFDWSDLADMWPKDNGTDDYFYFGEEDGGSWQCGEACGEAEKVLNLLVPPLLLLVGLPANLLLVVAMHELVWRGAFPLCGYVCLLAVLDSVLLLLDTGNECLARLTRYNLTKRLTTASDTLCKLVNFARNLAVHHAVWLLVVVLIEWQVLVHAPHKIRSITPRRVLDTLAFVSVLLICANCHYFWTHGINSVTVLGVQVRVCQFQARTLDGQIIHGAPPTNIIWTTLHDLLATVLPALCFLVLLVLSARSRLLAASSPSTAAPGSSSSSTQQQQQLAAHILRRRCRNREKQARGLAYERRGVRLDAALIGELSARSGPLLAVLFLLCATPHYLHAVLEQRLGGAGQPDVWALTGLILRLLNSLPYCCKLFVFIATSPVFRKTCRDLLRRRYKALLRTCRFWKYESVTERRSETRQALIYTTV